MIVRLGARRTMWFYLARGTDQEQEWTNETCV